MAAMRNLLTLLKVNVTKNTITGLQFHPEYPALSALTDFLNDLRVKNLAVRIPVEGLRKIPYPAIAYLEENNGRFVVLTKHIAGNIYYIDSEKGKIVESLNDFETKWKGVTLLTTTSNQSGELGYSQKKKIEKLKVLKRISSVVFLIIFLGAAIALSLASQFFLCWLLILIIKACGGAISVSLFAKQIGKESSFSYSVCNASRLFDCNRVLNSSASKVFGIIGATELGILYFFGGILALLLGSISKINTIEAMFIFNIVALPYTPLSVYYQWKVVKAWCPFCIAVVVLLWFEFITFISFHIVPSITEGGILVSITFILSALGWGFIHDSFIQREKIETLEKVLRKLRYSRNLFNKLLESQPKIEIEDFANEIFLGNPSATACITVVSAPTCAPCAQAHLILENLVELYNFKLRLRFSIDSSNTQTIDYKVVRALVEKAAYGDFIGLQEAVKTWYAESDFDSWIVRVKAPNQDTMDSNLMTDTIKQHTEWCNKQGITGTPTFFLNGKRLPEEYTVLDLAYHVRHWCPSS